MGCDAAKSNILNPHCLNSEIINTPLQSVTFTGCVGNFETEIVIDSGSGITIMSFDLFNLINKYAKSPLEMSNNAVLAKTATGESLEILGTTCVELDLSDSQWYVDCYVVRNFRYPFLLGTDFLVKSNATIDMAKMQATIAMHTVPISVVKRARQVPVCVMETMEIPSRSEAILTGRISGLQGTVLVEPKYEISSSNSILYPARSVANVSENKIPVKVINANDFPVKIFAGTCVGTAETFEEPKDLHDKGESTLHNLSNCNWLNDIDLQNCSISDSERCQLLSLLSEFKDVFVKSDSEFGRANRFSHNIDTGDNPPCISKALQDSL